MSFTQDDCEGFRRFLDSQVAQSEPAIASVQMTLRENLYGFQGNQQSPYLKITVTDPKFISRVRSAIEKKVANYKGLWKGIEGGILTFDSIEYILRFMIDTGVRRSVRTHTARLTLIDIGYVMGRGAPWSIPHYFAKFAAIELPNRGRGASQRPYRTQQ